MFFGPKPVTEIAGCILAHSVKTPERTLKKGRFLTVDDSLHLAASGIEEVIVAALGEDDIHEDDAANRLASGVSGAHIRLNAAFTGRANLYAETDGVMRLDEASLNAFNFVDEAITLATLPAFSRVTRGQMLGTLKIIPFSVPDSALEKCLRVAQEPLIDVRPFLALRVGLIQTRGTSVKDSVISSTRAVTEARITALGSALTESHVTAHDTEELSTTLTEMLPRVDIALVIGASAIVDRRDVIPAAIETSGGIVSHFGMPVDPGNLLLMGSFESKPILGLPGCARSPKLNGFDWVLERLCAGLETTPSDIMMMGAGGLLKEIRSRPLPRESIDDPPDIRTRPRIACLVLAAGTSRRMGAENKLLKPIDNKPVVAHVVDQALLSQADEVFVVTGYAAEDVKLALADRAVACIHNPDFEQGMSTSLKAGARALKSRFDAVLVVLGDMPLSDHHLMDRLIAGFSPEDGREIVVPIDSTGRRGNPVLWSSKFADHFDSLEGDAGAKLLLQRFSDSVTEISTSDDWLFKDVDTEEMFSDVAQELTKRTQD